ncbi:MAG: hypothetical protein AAF468_19885 [Pseudomonadota bacterium]
MHNIPWKSILVAFAVGMIVWAVASAQAHAHPVVCLSSESAKSVSPKFDIKKIGIAGRSLEVIEMWADSDGDWQVVAVMADGRRCLLLGGRKFHLWAFGRDL